MRHLLSRGKALLREPGETLGRRVMHAGFWAFALRVVERLFGLVRIVVLARLLAPEDFGLFGIALLALSALEKLSRTGFQQALIQRKQEVRAYLDTAWTLQVARGLVLTLVLFAAAPYVAVFFEEPRATPLLRALGLAALLRGFTNVGIVYLHRELDFRKRFTYRFSGTFADLVVAVTASLLLRSAWGLVFGLLAGYFVRMVVSYQVHAYRPQFRFDWGRAVEMYRFGRWVFGSSIVVFLATQGDDIFLAEVLGVVALGLYQVAFRFSNMMATEITHVISQVTFPAYSKLQDAPAKLKRAFLPTLETTVAVTVPLTIGIIILAPDFVRLFLGADKWMPMVPILQILAVSGLMRAVASTGGALFRAVGRPHLDFWMNLARVAAMAAAIYPLTMRYGAEGTAGAVVLGVAVTLPTWWIISRRIVRAGRREMLKLLWPTLVCAGGMGLLTYTITEALGPLTGWEFALVVLVSLLTYALGLILCWTQARTGPLVTLYTFVTHLGGGREKDA